jgi:hypothetical protein
MTDSQKAWYGLGKLAGTLFLEPYIVMLLLGASHSHSEVVPAFGYWTLFFLLWALRIAFSQRDAVTMGIKDYVKLNPKPKTEVKIHNTGNLFGIN